MDWLVLLKLLCFQQAAHGTRQVNICIARNIQTSNLHEKQMSQRLKHKFGPVLQHSTPQPHEITFVSFLSKEVAPVPQSLKVGILLSWLQLAMLPRPPKTVVEQKQHMVHLINPGTSPSHSSLFDAKKSLVPQNVTQWRASSLGTQKPSKQQNNPINKNHQIFG